MLWFWTLAPMALAFALGSIPFAHLAGKVHGIDLRKHGSGNVGATNALRVLGTPTGIAVLAMDAGKGALAVILASHWARSGLCPVSIFPMLCGFLSVMGHVFSPFMAFRGGKGVATGAGVFLALTPVALGLAFSLFVLVVALTRYVSAGSMLSALALPFLVWWQQGCHPNLLLASSLSLLILFRHRSNFDRLIEGKESKIVFSRKGKAATKGRPGPGQKGDGTGLAAEDAAAENTAAEDAAAEDAAIANTAVVNTAVDEPAAVQMASKGEPHV